MAQYDLSDRKIGAHFTINISQLYDLEALAKRLNCHKSELIREGIDLVVKRHAKRAASR